MGDPVQTAAGATLSGIFTAAKNVAQGINQLAQNYLDVQGLTNTANISAAMVVKPAPGRICTLIVLTGGAAGTVYDAAAIAGAASQLYPVFDIPTTAGVYVLNFPMKYGIVVSPGAAQVVSVSWS